MTGQAYDREITGLLVIDPYNDFISEGGKIWGRLRAVAEANNCVPHMLQILNAARKAKLRVFYAMHHRYRPGDYESWQYIAPVQKAAWRSKAFEYGSWGGEIRAGFEPAPDEVVATEHWRDATADYSDEAMHAALDVNMPNYASVVTTDEVIGSISSAKTLELSAQ
jgi:ureidoacrylate peracid hydrolase